MWEKIINKKINDLRVAPPDKVWSRLEARLDQDEGKVPASTLWKWQLGVAASLLLGIVLYFAQTSDRSHLVLEELDAMPKASFTAYRYVEICHLIYATNQIGNDEIEKEQTLLKDHILRPRTGISE